MRPPRPIPEERLAELAEFGRANWKGREREFLRYLCVWLRVEDGMPATEIAVMLRLSPGTVRATQAAFAARGAEAFEAPKRGGRRNQRMAPEEEEEFLGAFEAAAAGASVLTVAEMKGALEARIGRGVHLSTVYRLLERNGWRKVAPRPRQDREAAGVFKKGASRRR
jgi:transposase